MGRPPNQEIDRQAAEWAARRDCGSLAPNEEVEFNAWLSADRRHLGAYAKAETVLALLERGSAAGADAFRPAENGTALSRRHVLLTGSVAASLAVVSAGAGIGWRYFAT